MARRRSPATTTFAGIAYRYSNYDTPFWARPNTQPGRWHTAGDAPTQYLSATSEGAWAELIRAESLRSEADVRMVRMPLWHARIDEGNVVDYSSFELAERAGFEPDALVDDDQHRCRIEGKRLRELGYRGVLAPSAALPGTTNLTLFGPRVSIGWGSDATLASAIPAALLTHGGPPPGLVDRVRLHGQVHAALRDHLSARPKQRPA